MQLGSKMKWKEAMHVISRNGIQLSPKREHAKFHALGIEEINIYICIYIYMSKHIAPVNSVCCHDYLNIAGPKPG